MAIKDIIFGLEQKLLDSATRKSANHLSELISDDFREFGQSGKEYNKQDVLKALPDEKERDFLVDEFKVNNLSESVALATYISIEGSQKTLRSSIWKKSNNEWKMVFHQGTKIEE